MALNVRPEYIRAEEQYKAAQTTHEKLAALREMLATAPKHKASEKLLKDIKQRISRLRQESSDTRKKSGQADPFNIPHQGAGQVLLIGPPNAGKSSILQALTKSPVKVAEFPFTTQVPIPGMALHEDVPIQLIDTPPVTADHIPAGMAGAIDHADAILIVVDGSAQACLEDVETCLLALASRKLYPAYAAEPDAEDGVEGMPVRCLAVCTRGDVPETQATLETLRELYPQRIRFEAVSCETGAHLPEMMRLLFDLLDVVRIYSKPQGKPADMEKPFILHRGSTVHDLANHIHHELGEKVHGARIWGSNVHDGQQVHVDHVLSDRDVVQLHV